MRSHDRREFLADVGRGMLIGSVGTALAADMGLGTVGAAEDDSALNFGSLEPLVAQMQQTPAEKIVPAMIARMKEGLDLKTLTAAAALANARTFGGQDYVGFHTFMALAPAYDMARMLPTELASLPVLKVIHRNTNRIQQKGGRKEEVLRAVKPAEAIDSRGIAIQAATRAADAEKGERILAKECLDSPGEAYNHLQYSVQDDMDVHRVVLAWRAWASLDFVGKEHATTLLRQSVRYCVNVERHYIKNKRTPAVRRVLPKLMDSYKLLSKGLGTKKVDDAWVDRASRQLYAASPEAAADLAAAALADGIDPEVVGEAIALAACRLVLHDVGRRPGQTSDGKPEGSCHGDSVGVHASDAANAWRNIARVSDTRNRIASLIVGAYHTAGQSRGLNRDPYPTAEHLEKVTTRDPKALLKLADEAIRGQNQAAACAAIHRYGEQGHDPEAVLALMVRFATSEDGALHAEKYFRTVREEFKATRSAFRWRQLVALARVTASEYGRTAPGYKQARELLKVGV
jgi:hypothetical protein